MITKISCDIADIKQIKKFYKIEKHNDEVKNNLVNFKVGELKEDN